MHNTNKPLVSIAMCTYNGERFLREQIDSLVAQDYPNLEIIIADDKSTDSTFQILEEYQQRHSNFRVLQNETNLGFVKNFEKVISLCSGEYISLCDQDDIWFPHKVSSLISEIGSASLIYSKLSMIDEKGNPISKSLLEKRLHGTCHLGLLFSNCVTGHASIVRKETALAALPIPKNIDYHDHWFAFVAAADKGIKASDQILSLYRIHDTNASFRKNMGKPKGLLRKKLERITKAKIRLKKRIAFLEGALTCQYLEDDDRDIVMYLLVESRRLTRLISNNRLRKYLTQGKDRLLSIYLDPYKRSKKLSRGLWFYILRI